MDFKDLLVPMDEPISSTRNGTTLSRFSESIIRTFLSSNANEARVRVELTDYSSDQLYEGLRKVTRKNDFKNRLIVHKQNGKIVLLRNPK